MDFWHLASLIISLSPADLLSGSPQCLLQLAQRDPKYGAGFHDLPQVSLNESKNVTYAVFVHDEFVLVIFPGSQMREEDWTGETGNLNFERISVRALGGEVHEGFWNQVNSYWSGGRGLVQKLREHGELPVVVGGHSRGGACAVIAGLRIERELENRLGGVITVGQPKCVDREIAGGMKRRWANRYVRIVSSRDPVPLVPPGVSYKHAGTVWFYDDGGEWRQNPSKLEIWRAIERDNPAVTSGLRRKKRFIRGALEQGWASLEGHRLAYYDDLVHGGRGGRNGG